MVIKLTDSSDKSVSKIDKKVRIVDILRSYLCLISLITIDTWKLRILKTVAKCGTEELGGFCATCISCGYSITGGRHCNSRNCPNCGGNKRRIWSEKLADRILPTKHFHLVFTLPHQYNNLFAAHQTPLLNLLMISVREVLDTFVKRTFKGGKAGYMMVLHTWNQELLPHYHVHVLITAGAISKSCETWIDSQKKFLFPVHALAKVFRATFKNKISKHFAHTNQILPSSPKKWNVYCKKPYNNEHTCIKYFALYCNRVAISDRRIVAVSYRNKEVSIAYKKTEKTKPSNTFNLSFRAFLTRFALHILPKGFSKIRYGGLYANRANNDNKKRALDLLYNSKALKNVGSCMSKEPSTGSVCPKCSHILRFSITLYSKAVIEKLKNTGPPLSTNKMAQSSLPINPQNLERKVG